MRVKAQGDQAQRPQSNPGTRLPQPLCQKGPEMQWRGGGGSDPYPGSPVAQWF